MRELDRRPRREPDFIVAGPQKAASTSLFAYLASSPEVAPPLVKEINYFDLRADKGHAWYLRHFPLRDGTDDSGRLTGEASPMYMAHPLAMDRIARDLPRVKIVVILRHPLTRLLSHYRHNLRLGHERFPLAEALAVEGERIEPDLGQLKERPYFVASALWKYSYLYRSLYDRQIARIQELFPGRHLVLRLEDLTTPPDLEPLCDFVDIPFVPAAAFEAHNVNRSTQVFDAGDVPPDLLDRLRDDASRTTERLGWPAWAF